MRLVHLYYDLKPYIPQRLRMAVRSSMARSIRKRSTNIWPINQRAGLPPENWPGWPDGKKFALVLTHDVESGEGLPECHRIEEMEASHGFRSSFNFIPEGDYEVSAQLRSDLRSRGFEIGVHDLKHDGKLYRSRSDFRRHAREINRYLKEWGAIGFRSGFMHHRLDWLHDLEIEYDLSTFDTDPFEPQPDGVDTIFPFWVPHPVPREEVEFGRSQPSGYVELPYTLPQDSTLFLLLREKSIDVWKRKLDWIAEHGGMALLNVHPDYVCSSDPGRMRYPIRFYEEFLEYVKTAYAGLYWSALPSEVCKYVRTFVPLLNKHPRLAGVA